MTTDRSQSLPHILIIDDSEFERALLRALLQRQKNYTCLEAGNGQDALTLLQSDVDQRIAAVLLDLSMPEIGGKDLLPLLLSLRPDLGIIIVTGTQNAGDIVAMIKMGASDYLIKPVNPDLLINALEKIVHIHVMRQEIARLKSHDRENPNFSKLIGHHTSIKNCIKLASRAALSDITVLITGESGVGKEIMARAIHAESERKDKPFVAVNCGALPKDLVESTLFGHKKGAFTGAVTDSLGKFREADGGTLFLDEIGELPLEAQVKLLRVLQEREVEPVGSGKTIPINIRIIAATNRDPQLMVVNGHFREDLFYRLNVFPISIPSLRERAGDIRLLAMHFLQRYGTQENKSIDGFTDDAINWLNHHTWPGNVRELENTIYRAVLLCDQPFIGLEHITGAATIRPMAVIDAPTEPKKIPEAPAVSLFNEQGQFRPMADLRLEIEQAAIDHAKGNIDRAAALLGIGKSTLYRRKQI